MKSISIKDKPELDTLFLFGLLIVIAIIILVFKGII